MIKVENLTKRFGTTLAIENVSFTVEKGELVGFLGPNGAGKTTTMRILAGSLGASSGKAKVAGLDVSEHPREVKRRLGYLPETPPVYANMTVAAYVRFAAVIKGVEDPDAAVGRVLAQVGLQAQGHRLIDHLSKGFKQRVGLAQALVHEPSVLILDEPTSGLDPAQRVEIRDLIKSLAEGERTVILSTHVLSEVEAICGRVVIINEGRVVAKDTIDALARNVPVVTVRLGNPTDAFAREVGALAGVDEVTEQKGGLYQLHLNRDVRPDVARIAARFDLLEMTGRERLEDVYLRLTAGRAD